MGNLYDKIKQNTPTQTDKVGGGSLYKRIQNSKPITQPKKQPEEEGFLSKTYEKAKGLFTGIPEFEVDPKLKQNLIEKGKTEELKELQEMGGKDVGLKEVAKEIPETAVKGAGGFAETFTPAIKNFFETTGSIIGEGLAYAVDEDVRKQYKAGNLELLPTISETTQADLAKDTIAAGIETAVYRSFPDVAKMKLWQRGGLGAIEGIGFAISEGLADDKSAEEIINSLPAYGIMGSTANLVAPYLMPLLKSELKQVPKGVKNIFKGLKREAVEKTPPGMRKLAVTGEEKATKIPTKKAAKQAEEAIPETKIAKEVEPETTIKGEEVARVPEEQLPVGGGETKISRLERRLKNRMDDMSPAKAEEEGIATYKQMNKAEQIKKATEYVEKNPDEALDVLKGNKPPPEGLLHNSVALALEEKATIEADRSLATKLASLRSTRAGQEISLLTETDPSNPISAMNQVIKAKKAKASKKFKGKPEKVVKENAVKASKEISKKRLKIGEAEDLLNKIVC